MYNEDDNSSSLSQHENDFSSDDDMDWEQVDVLEATHQAQSSDATTVPFTSQLVNEGPSKSFEITLDDQENEPKTMKKRVMSHAERVLRLQVHKIHTICLISNGRIRNRYLNDKLLHARLMSLVPLQLQLAFSTIHKKREPDVRQRGRMFENAVKRLAQWWRESFFKADPPGSGEIQNRTFDEVQRELIRKQKKSMRGETESEDEGEIIRSCKSLQKHVLLREGSRDVSAQLFTALCRALDIPARLIISIQSVPWKASLGKDPAKVLQRESPQPQIDRKGKGKAVFPGVGQTLSGKTPETEKKVSFVKLRKQQSRGKTLRQSQKTPNTSPQDLPPTQWTEVFSRADGRWFSIDPIRDHFNDKAKFEPPKHDRRNRMVYVLAFEEDGYARDVTQRYAREFSTKTSKLRLGGKGKKEWWDAVMSLLSRPYRLHRDDLEDAELQHQQIIEGMPTSVVAFKDHPLYVLERHVLRDQVIHPRNEIGRFRGEPVFSRTNLLVGLKTSENWMRSGRVVKEGEQPLKTAKVRPVTINRKRALEVADTNASTSEETSGVTQGLYADFQTELYIPRPVVNGKIPKNDFGNIDLYVDTMLPAGAVHVPFKGSAKIAKDLGFDYAEAVTGFEFKNRRAFPILTGIVIAAENESAFLEAYWEVTKDAEEKERLKKENRLLKQWAKFINGLRVKKRLQEQYASDGNKNEDDVDNQEVTGEHEPGGFLIEMADNVVQAYTLPKQAYPVAQTINDSIPNGETDLPGHSIINVLPEVVIEEEGATDETIMATEMEPFVQPSTAMPKTLQEIAEANPEIFQPVEETDIPAVLPVTPAKPLQGRNPPPRRAKQTPKSTSTTKKSTRRRKRPRTESSGSEAQEPDNEDSDAPPRSRRKRTPVAASPSTRVLRPRKLKTEEALRQEREKENAIESALLD